jgi:hypothetical protein
MYPLQNEAKNGPKFRAILEKIPKYFPGLWLPRLIGKAGDWRVHGKNDIGNGGLLAL